MGIDKPSADGPSAMAGLWINNNTSKAILNLQSFTEIDTVILQAGKLFLSVIYCDYVIRLYKIENRYFLQVW